MLLLNNFSSSWNTLTMASWNTEHKEKIFINDEVFVHNI